MIMSKDKSEIKHISLSEAAKYSGRYSQDYLSLRARQGKLKAIKIGRNWVTKKEWVGEYLKQIEDFKNKKAIKKPERTSVQKAQRTAEICKIETPPSKPVPVRLGPPRALAVMVALVFVLGSLGVIIGYPYYGPALKSVGSFVAEDIPEAAADMGDKLCRYVNQDIGAFQKFSQELPQNIRSNVKFSAGLLMGAIGEAGKLVKNTAKRGGELVSSPIKKSYQFITRPWRKKVIIEERVIEEIVERVLDIIKEEAATESQ